MSIQTHLGHALTQGKLSNDGSIWAYGVCFPGWTVWLADRLEVTGWFTIVLYPSHKIDNDGWMRDHLSRSYWIWE